MAQLYRLWAALRRPVVASWSSEAAAHWDTAVKGSSALRTAMVRLIRNEAAQRLGFAVGGVFYDAANFYDNVDLALTMEQAEELQYPLAPLALAVQLYLAPRIVRAQEA
eukprot:2773808-Lingulodinium_polyedra.AAC.1